MKPDQHWQPTAVLLRSVGTTDAPAVGWLIAVACSAFEEGRAMKIYARVILLAVVILPVACQPANPTPTERPTGQVETQVAATIAAGQIATAAIEQAVGKTLTTTISSLTPTPIPLTPTPAATAQASPILPTSQSRIVIIDTDMAPDDWGQSFICSKDLM